MVAMNPPFGALPGTLWLREHWLELADRNFQWVAATGEGVVANGERLDEVMDEVMSRGLAEAVVYAYVDFPRPVVL